MTDPKATYQTRLKHFNDAANLQKKRMRRTSLLRMAVFIGACYMVYGALQGSGWHAPGALLMAGVFVYLVARYQDLKYESKRLGELIRLNQTELGVLEGNYSHLEDGAAFQEADHAFAGDLDLFGPSSFFQYVNRTGLASGTSTLARWLCANDSSGVTSRQEAIRELKEQLDWRQDFTATARLIAAPLSARELTGWMHHYSPGIPFWVKNLPLGFSGLSLVMGFLVAFGVLPPAWLLVLFFTGLSLTLPFAKKIGQLAALTGKTQETFRQYRHLVGQVESHTFHSERLKNLKAQLDGPDRSVSDTLHQFSRLIGALDQRNNLLVAVFANAFFLWDLKQAYAVERWIGTYGNQTREWFEALSGFDAWNSLSNFAYNHPGYVFPEVTNSKDLAMEARHLAHPLLRGTVVCNDVRIEKGHFMVITGANMAGKSTFLRAISLSVLMANCGLPVCAREMSYSPMPLITSMRTTDSLSRQESYFFAELKRLKVIVDHLKEGPYFVVLDEILKGTNSKDKARGSKEFLARLLRMDATGLIATHDLSLCEVAALQPEVQNYFFDVEIREGQLFFDYKLKPGVCSNMNASFLLRKLGVVEEGD
ncbi:MAG: DNA mismatch repair protein MutS [Robiginitalea sp.]|nr:DNA mismatch repair protein MutS [Robiginitalea sp.]